MVINLDATDRVALNDIRRELYLSEQISDALVVRMAMHGYARGLRAAKARLAAECPPITTCFDRHSSPMANGEDPAR